MDININAIIYDKNTLSRILDELNAADLKVSVSYIHRQNEGINSVRRRLKPLVNTLWETAEEISNFSSDFNEDISDMEHNLEKVSNRDSSSAVSEYVVPKSETPRHTSQPIMTGEEQVMIPGTGIINLNGDIINLVENDRFRGIDRWLESCGADISERKRLNTALKDGAVVCTITSESDNESAIEKILKDRAAVYTKSTCNNAISEL